MVTIRVETIGDERFIRAFSRIEKELDDFRMPLELIAQHFWMINEANFESEGDPDKFTPLSPRYKRWKDKHYPGKKIMQLTERLKNSLAATKQMDAQDTIKVIRRKYAELGTRVPYAHRHQKGTHGMPQRKVVQVQEKHKRVWSRIIHRWAMGLFRLWGFKVYEEAFGGVL